MGIENNKLVRKVLKLEDNPAGSSTMAIVVGLFAAFAGMLFGYDIGNISGILAMDYVLDTFPTDGSGEFTSNQHAMIVALLSIGSVVGAMSAPYMADSIGRRWSLIFATFIVFNLGVALQTGSTNIPLLVVGRVIAGAGVGMVTAVVPLYQAECAPRWIRGALTSLYQFAVSVGLLLAAIIVNATRNRQDSGSYRIPIAVQFIWSLIITIGFVFLPETPRFFVLKGNEEKAAQSLSRLRRLPVDHPVLLEELLEIKANFEYEKINGSGGWSDCFMKSNNQRWRVMTGVGVQMFQQLAGNNFIFYYGTTFFKSSGISNEFLINVAVNVVNCGMTLPASVLSETLGRRMLLLAGSLGMGISELLIAIIGTAADSSSSNKATVAFSCIFIAFFACTWGPIAWVLIAEIMPLNIRSKGVALSATSNWVWNFAIAYMTPYLVDTTPGSANLGSKVFFIWGGCNIVAFVWTYFFVFETRGLSLEQVDEMYEVVPRAWQSVNFVPTVNRYSEATHEKDENVDDAFENDRKPFEVEYIE